MAFHHIPVLADEVLAGLALQAGERVLDGTVGLGGHARLLLEATAPDGHLVAFDRDARNLALAQAALGDAGSRTTFIHDSYGNVANHAVGVLDGALLDLGFSSVHVDDPTRGFSFLHDGPLDMRYDVEGELSAADIVNTWSADDLATIFRRYGEELAARKIADALVSRRKVAPLTTTADLADVVSSLILRRGKAHPATKVFQALRIVVNDELGELERGLIGIVDALRPGGRLAVITFHSLEDRLVKQWVRDHDDLVAQVGKKPTVASREEVRGNPRSRSAKLRIIERKL